MAKIDNWNDYQASPELAKLKEQFRNGEEPKECVKCWVQEEAGFESLRTMTAPIAKRFPINYNEVNDPVQIELAITRVCNLACRICGPDSSSRWVKDHNELFKIGLADEYTASPKRHLRDPEFVDWVLAHQSNLEYLQFIGGEPFADQIAEQVDLLSKLEHPENIELSYMTNGTFLPASELEEQWKKFKLVKISVSLDGIEDVFEYGRYPAKWDDVEFNLVYWSTLAYNNDNVHLTVNNTISAINVFNVPEFDAWTKKCNLDVYYQVLEGPPHYNIKNLNPEVKAYLSCKLADFPEVLSALNKEPDQLYYHNSLIRNLKALDKMRSQSFLDLYPPEFTKLFKY
jgi:MoaA/NifB/PqqE/SkfB family radical SAM enzyme